MATFRSSIPDFSLGNQLYTTARVTFYTVGVNGVRTNTLALLYSEPTGTLTLQNPQTLDGEGKFFAPVYIDGPVIGEVVGPNIDSHGTGIINARGTWKGTWTAGAHYYSSDFVVDPDNPVAVYIAVQDFNAGASFAADLAAGKFQLVVTGGDVMYVTVDDTGRPATGEKWRTIFSDPVSLPVNFGGSRANCLTMALATTVFSVKKNNVVIGGLTFSPGSLFAMFDSTPIVHFASGDEMSITAPTRDETLSGIAVTIKLTRTP